MDEGGKAGNRGSTGINEMKRKILYHENYDIKSVITPVNWRVLKNLLDEANYNKKETEFLTKGFRDGFRIEYHGDRRVKRKAPNLKLRVGDEIDLWNKVMKEVKLKRYAGPFKENEIPYRYYIQSPIGLVPKDNGADTRLIFHLSYPKNDSKTSVNSNTPEHLCKVNYPDFSEAIMLCLKEGVACNLARSDFKAAFRNLGLFPGDFKFLLMKARSPLDGATYFFLDKCLPFGCSISCSHFQRFSNCVAYLVYYRTHRHPVNYLDDYLFAALIRSICNQQIEIFLLICKKINFPVNLDKTYWASTQITFLGFLIDTVAQLVSIPKEKVTRAINMISGILSKKSKKMTLLQLQKVCGFLNFLGRAIVPGRAFTRRLYAHQNGKLKPHHHLKISSEMRMDLEMWLEFLMHPTAALCRPFMDYGKTWNAKEIEFFMDSSKNAKLGMGGYCKTNWMIQQWDANFISEMNPSIEFLELYATTAGILAWIHEFSNMRIILFTDNISAMHMINSTSSRCKNCMILIRIIVLKSLLYNVRIYSKHVSSKKNSIADSLSRFQMRRFANLTRKKNMASHSTKISDEIWPMSKIWIH